MDACLDCCGLRRRARGADPENHETFRLLYDEPYRSHYGAGSQHYNRAIQSQPDPEVLRREREEMETICQRMSSQVIDVFNVVPTEATRSLTLDQAKAMLIRNGIIISNLSESKILAFAQQSPAGQARAIRAYHDNARGGQRPRQDDKVRLDGNEVEIDTQPPHPGIRNADWSATNEELIYKTIKRPKRDPVSIELGRNESKAAKAAIG